MATSGRVPVPPDAVLGFEVAGVVDALGPLVSGVQEGDEVASLLLGLGGYGAYALASSWTLKPPNVTWSDAAALPVAAEAAVGILKQLGVARGETLLVLGAAGSVGLIATQLAVLRGATVVGAAAPRDHDLVRDLRRPGQLRTRSGRSDTRDRPVSRCRARRGREGWAPRCHRPCWGSSGVMTLADEHAADLGVASLPTPDRAPEALDQTMPLLVAGALHLRRQRHLPMEHAAQAHRLLENGEAHEKLILHAP